MRKRLRGVGDHPRGCGEKLAGSPRAALAPGSSPRVRGKGVGLRFVEDSPGIIPAGAGKRASSIHATAFPRDHPRGCGEKPPGESMTSRMAGSSPRVRGKAVQDFAGVLDVGIIPAGAGKSRDRGARRGRPGDHPRGCGEKRKMLTLLSTRRGSSPRVRGKGGGRRPFGGASGIIPAGAGKSSYRTTFPAEPRDHPRGCGEKNSALSRRLSSAGSSPRVRGKAAGVAGGLG